MSAGELRRISRMGYRPAYDGLRGVSILGIMLIHGNVSWGLGAFLMVDVFFLLSGFLITRLLLEERLLTGGIAIVRFYLRRALRLFPALVVVCIGCAIYAAFWLGPDQTSRAFHDVFATATYRMNWTEALHDRPPFGLLDHAWTLSVEEQFYLLWPLVVVVAYRLGRTRGVLVAGLGGFVATCVWRAVLATGGSPHRRLYYGLDTHADGLLLGCALAAATVLWPDIWGALTRGAARWAGPAALVALAVATYQLRLEDSGLDTWGYPLLAVVIAVVVADVFARGLTVRALGLTPLVAVGRVSYGLYLWHWPVFLVINGDRFHLPFVALTVVRITVSGAFAVASFFLVEQPFLRLKQRIEPPGRPSEPAFEQPEDLAAPSRPAAETSRPSSGTVPPGGSG